MLLVRYFSVILGEIFLIAILIPVRISAPDNAI